MDESASRPRITVVGLGPADLTYLSPVVSELIATAARTLVRTRRHPSAAGLSAAGSLDHHYQRASTFDEAYGAMVEELVAEATTYAPDPIIYAVPGSPLIAERTVELLRSDARVDVTVVPALSFLDLAWERLGIDPLTDAVRLVDAERFVERTGGMGGPFLVAQCWSQTLLSDIKLSVADRDDDALPEVVLLHHLGLEDEQVVSLEWWEMDRTLTPDHLTSLFIPALPDAGREMARLEHLMRTLREQCPWDRAQTHATLMPHLLEESYEVLDALEELAGAPGAREDAFSHLEEELGDLLFQIVFHARLGEEEGRFTLDDVARGVHDKLVLRHPHVFADVDATTAEQVMENWEEIKRREKGRTSVTDGIPHSLPALLFATKLQRKALSIDLGASGPPDSTLLGLLERVGRAAATESTREDPDAPLAKDDAHTAADIGEILFLVADLARRLKIDPEQALRSRSLALRDEIVAHEIADAAD